MADYKGSSKLVTSSYLYRMLKAEDDRRAKKLHTALYDDIPEIPEHYSLAEQQDGSTPNSLVIVANGTISNPDTEIELATVQGKMLPDDLHIYNVGEYVVLNALVPEESVEKYLKASTLAFETELIDFGWDDEPSQPSEHFVPISESELNDMYDKIYKSVFGND